ncbi:MAG: hypothetical protein J7497_02360 [Chitinophagaceae bacterium]|nr:hypothetical protein [Chitinophagaceae bacterium]
MARVSNNALTDGMSGKLGSVVFRTRNGKTFACARPSKKRNRYRHPHQAEIQTAFIRHVRYAKYANSNPGLKAFYSSLAKPGQSAYNLAFKDAAQGPRINKIIRMQQVASIDKFGNIEISNEATAQCLVIYATDNFQVELVSVQIFTGDGETVLEEGFAKLQGLHWIYTLKSETATRSQLKVHVVATDLPGNNAELEVIC